MTDWSPLISAGALIVTSVLVPMAIAAYQKRTGIALTDQQRAAVQGSLATAAGLVETLIDRGKLAVADVRPDHPAIVEAAVAALQRVPDAAAAQHVSPTAAAEIVVGRVRTAPPAVAALGALLALFLSGCAGSSGPGSIPISPAQVAAIETTVTIAGLLAGEYTRLPSCPMVGVPCADPVAKARLQAAGARAHDAVVVLRSSSAAGAPAAYAVAAAALAALEASTPGRPAAN